MPASAGLGITIAAPQLGHEPRVAVLAHSAFGNLAYVTARLALRRGRAMNDFHTVKDGLFWFLLSWVRVDRRFGGCRMWP